MKKLVPAVAALALVCSVCARTVDYAAVEICSSGLCGIGLNEQPETTEHTYRATQRWFGRIERVEHLWFGVPFQAPESWHTVRVVDVDGGLAIRFLDARGRPVNTLWGGQEILLRKGPGKRSSAVRRTRTGLPVPERFTGTHQSYYVFDGRGRSLERSYHDRSGAPQVALGSGVHREVVRRNAVGHVVERSLFGKNGKMVGHRTRYLVDSTGRPERIQEFGEDGKLAVSPTTGCARFDLLYDNVGNHMEVACFDAEGKPNVNLLGPPGLPVDVRAHRVRWKRVRGRVTEQVGSDVSGVLRAVSRLQRIVTSYAPDGVETESHFDANGAPVLYDGAHRIRRTRNAQMLVIETSYFDGKGKAALGREKWHRATRVFDKLGRLREEAHFGVDGGPNNSLEGAHKKIRKYDADHNLIEVRFFDGAGGPMIGGIENAHWIVNSFDANGHLTEMRRYDAQDRPTDSTPPGYHRARYALDRHGNFLEARFLSGRNELRMHPQLQAARVVVKRNEWGDVTEHRLFDAHGAPVARLGVFVLRSKYDARGNRSEESYFGANDEPATVRGLAIHRITSTYADNGAYTEKAYFNTKGLPAEDGKGVARIVREFDESGTMRKAVTYRADGSVQSIQGH